MNRPWMPLYPADYLRDTGHLSTLEHGAYLLLILHYWSRGGLPASDVQLQRICRVDAGEWACIRPTLADLFDTTSESWKHKRIEEELAKAADISGKRRASAQKRHAKEPAPAAANAGANAEQLHTQSQSQSQTNYTHSAPAVAKPDLAGMHRALFDAAGTSLKRGVGKLEEAGTLRSWIAAGCDFDADILPAIQVQCAGKAPNTVGTWSFFTDRIRENRDRRLAMLAPVDPAVLTAVRPGKPRKAGFDFIAYAREKNGAAAHELASDDQPFTVLDAEPVAVEGAGFAGGDVEQTRPGGAWSYDRGECRADSGTAGLSDWPEAGGRPRLVAVRG